MVVVLRMRNCGPGEVIKDSKESMGAFGEMRDYYISEDPGRVKFGR